MPVDSAANIEATRLFLSQEEADGLSMRSRWSGGVLALFSYDEPIACWLDNRLAVELEWKYSRTTYRHRRLLMRLAAERDLDAKTLARDQIREVVGLDPFAPPPRHYVMR